MEEFGGIGNGNMVNGCGDFILKGVPIVVLREPRTIFTISFEDSGGTVFHKSVTVPVKQIVEDH